MARNIGDFTSGSGNPSSGVPTSNMGEDNIIKPIAEPAGTTRRPPSEPAIPMSAKEAERARQRGIDVPTSNPSARTRTPKAAAEKPESIKNDLQFFTKMTNKVPIGMNDSGKYTKHFINKVQTAHAELTGATSEFKNHPDLPTIAQHLNSAEHHHTLFNNTKANNTPFAWKALNHAQGQLAAAHQLLKGISSKHADDLAITHTYDNKDNNTQSTVRLEPADLQGNAPADMVQGGNPEELGPGKAVTNTRLAGKNITIPQNMEANLAVRKREKDLGVAGTEALRGDSLRAFRAKTGRTPRVRKMFRDNVEAVRTGKTSPKSNLPLVDSMGEAAVQPSRVGDWGGSEKPPTSPGQGYPRVAEKRANTKLRKSKSKLSTAKKNYKIAAGSTEANAAAEIKSAKSGVVEAGKSVVQNIGEVKAARNRDITYATGTPAPSPKQKKAVAKRNAPKGGAQ